MAQKRETVVVDELAAAVEAIVANSRKTSELASRFAEDYERLGQDRSTVPEVEATEEARVEAGRNELTAGVTLLSAVWGSPESRRRLAAITARAGEASRQATIEALIKFSTDECRRLRAQEPQHRG